MVVFEEAGILRILYEANEGLQVHEWIEYNPEDRDALVLRSLEQVYELLLEYPVEKLLVKTNKARGAFSPQVQNFIRRVQFPRILADTNIRFVATVHADYNWGRIGTELWQASLPNNSSLVRHNCTSETEAREWLRQISTSSI